MLHLLERNAWSRRLLHKADATCLRVLDFEEMATAMKGTVINIIIITPIRMERRRSWWVTAIMVMMMPIVMRVMMPMMRVKIRLRSIHGPAPVATLHGPRPVVLHSRATHHHS